MDYYRARVRYAIVIWTQCVKEILGVIEDFGVNDLFLCWSISSPSTSTTSVKNASAGGSVRDGQLQRYS